MAITSVGNSDGSQTSAVPQYQEGAVLGAIYLNPNTGQMELQGQGGWEPYTQDNGAPSPGYGGGYQAPDPYAKWGGAGRYNSLIQNNQNQENAIYGSANEAAQSARIAQEKGITSYLDSYRSGQKAIDTKGANNELARLNGITGVQGMVSRGIRSSGTMLANKNAGDSSAVAGIANAYGGIGQRQLANVGNQYELGNKDIALAQENLAQQGATYKRNYELDKQAVSNDIVREAGQSLSALDAQIVNQDLPGRIAIEQRKQEVKARAIAKLSELDQTLYSGIDNTKATSVEQRRTEAQGLRSAGTDLGTGAFQFTDQAPMTFSGESPSGGNLPLFTIPRGRRQA